MVWLQPQDHLDLASCAEFWEYLSTVDELNLYFIPRFVQTLVCVTLNLPIASASSPNSETLAMLLMP